MSVFRPRSERRMNCMQVGRRLQRFLDGDVDDLTARRIVRHLEDCRRCGMKAATYTEIKATLARRRVPVPDDALSQLRSFGERLIDEGPPDESDLPDDTAGA